MKLGNLLLLLFSIFVFSCDKDEDSDIVLPEDSWTYLGLGSSSINEIIIVEDEIYAATQQGMYKKSVSAQDTTWMEAGLANQVITDFVIFSPDNILASVELNADNPINTFYRTEDGGQNWASVQSNFGGSQSSQTCNALDVHPQQNNILYARGAANVAKSTNQGQTWESVYGDWQGIGYQADLIKVDENQPDTIWAGGETSIFSPYLVKSLDAGSTWQSMDIPYDGDNAVYSIVIQPDNSDHVLLGMEGRIIASEDGGSSWQIIFSPEAYSYIFDMQVSAFNQDRVYAIGTDGGTDLGDIIVYTSDDFGNNWKTERHAGLADQVYAAQDVALYTANNQEYLYIGTNRGVFIYRSS